MSFNRIAHGSRRLDRFYNLIFRNNWSQIFQFLGFVCQILTITIWQLRGYGRLSVICFIFGTASLCVSSFYAVAFRADCRAQYNKNTIFILILNVLSLFLLLRGHEEVVATIGDLREFLLLFGLSAVVCILLFQLLFTFRFSRSGNTGGAEKFVLAALCILFSFVLNIECFNTWTRWDSFQYFHETQKLSVGNLFSAGESSLMVCGHISASYVLLSFLFMSIPGLSVLNALYLSNMVLIAADFLLFYKIFRIILPKAKNAVSILYASVLVCTPSVFGSVAYYNAEHLLLTGTLLLIYAILRSNGILSVFAIFVLCYARENGAPLAAVLLFMQFIFCAYDSVKNSKRLHVDFAYYISVACIFVTWVLQYFSGHWEMGGTQSETLINGSDVFNTFGFSSVHIKDTLIVGLLANCRWVFTLLVLLGIVLFIVCLARKKISWEDILEQKGILLVASGAVSFLTLLSVYVTYSFDRYFVTFTGLFGILALYSLYYLFHRSKERRILHFIVAVFIGVFMLGECYVTIDPVTTALYPTVDTGDATLAVTPLHTNIWVDGVFAEHSTINRQVMYFEKTLDRAYSAIYDKCGQNGTKILCSDEYYVTPDAGSLLMIWGYGYTYITPPMWGVWNSSGDYRYLSFDPEEDEIIDPSYVLADSDLDEYTKQYRHVYYIEMPWGDTVIDALRERYPEIKPFEEIHYRGWQFNLYSIKE